MRCFKQEVLKQLLFISENEETKALLVHVIFVLVYSFITVVDCDLLTFSFYCVDMFSLSEAKM